MGLLNPEDLAVEEQIDFENDLVFAPERKGAQFAENPFEELNNGDDNDNE